MLTGIQSSDEGQQLQSVIEMCQVLKAELTYAVSICLQEIKNKGSLLKMGRQPAKRPASSGNLTVSLPSENVLFY